MRGTTNNFGIKHVEKSACFLYCSYAVNNKQISNHAENGKGKAGMFTLREQKTEPIRRIIMTREELKKILPEATDEVITELLNKNNSEVAKEKGRAEKVKAELDDLKASAANAEELQKKIEEIEQSKMTETEKIAKELEKSNARVAELERAAAIQNQRAEAASNFKITAEQAKTVVKDDGTIDYAILGQIIEEKETNAVSEYEKQKLAGTQNPGGSGGNNGDGKSSAVKLVERNFATKQANSDIISKYV